MLKDVHGGQAAPFVGSLLGLEEVIHGQDALVRPPLLAHSPDARRQWRHQDTLDLDILVTAGAGSDAFIVPVHGDEQAPNALVDDLAIPRHLLRCAHRRAERQVPRPPDVARARRIKVFRYAYEGARSWRCETAPCVVEGALGDARESEVVVARGEGARDGVVEATVKAPV